MKRSDGPIFIRHRVNRIADLADVDPSHGVEIDLRSGPDDGSIHLAHDPWEAGDPFEAWLDRFIELGIKGPIVLNTKVDGIEEAVIRLLDARGLDRWFFLDTQLPTLVYWTLERGEDRFAVRLSRYETAGSVAPFRGKARWLWVDCFGGEPLPIEGIRDVCRGFRICLVSPELQGASLDSIPAFAGLVPVADAICTRKPEKW